MKSWQIFHFFRKHIGSEVLYSIFGTKNSRTVDYWCQDPMYTAKPATAYDPIKGVKKTMEMLDSFGHIGIVRACRAYIFSRTSIACDIEPQIIEPQATINEEILLDYTAVGELHAAIKAGADPDEIDAFKDAALAEIERTSAKYRKDFRR